MKKRIQNSLHITCEDVNLTSVSNIEFYLRQSRFFRQYTPEVISEHEMVVVIPFEDAMKLMAAAVQLQFAFTDADGNPRATEIESVPVGDLLKEAGYDSV
jgi:hypothetical protein